MADDEVGRGSFGYVVSPPPVAGAARCRRDLVGKVFFAPEEDAVAEAARARALARRPGGDRHVLGPVPGPLLRRVPGSHPRVIWRGRPVLVMERMPATLCAARRFPGAVVWETLGHLAWLHAAGHAHLDVKAENVLCRLRPDGVAVPGSSRLIDFGLTRRLEDVRGRRDVRCGYAIYPPEVLRDWGLVTARTFPRTFGVHDAPGADAATNWRPRGRYAFAGGDRVDVWSWGVMWAELLPRVAEADRDVVRKCVRAALTLRAAARPSAADLLRTYAPGSPSAM